MERTRSSLSPQRTYRIRRRYTRRALSSEGGARQNAKMRTLQHVCCCVVMALGVLPVPPIKTLTRVAAASAEPYPLRHRVAPQWSAPRTWPDPLRTSRAASTGEDVVGLVANDPLRRYDVAAAEGDAAVTTSPATAASSSAPAETTTEESYESDADGNDFGSDVVNTLLEVVGALISFFTDPPGAIQKMVEQAQQLTSGARSLAATVREQRDSGVPTSDVLPGMVEQFKKLVDTALEVAKMGPEGARQATAMLQEAQKILEAARGIVETTGRVSNTARQVAQSISRPWRG